MLLLGFRSEAPSLLRLDDTARRLVGGPAFALGLCSAPYLLRLRQTGLLLGRGHATSFFLGAARLLLEGAALQLGPGSAESFLRVRQAAGLLLGLSDSTLLLLGLDHVACVLICGSALQLGPGSAESFLRVRQAAGMLLGLSDPTLLLLGLGYAASFFLSAAGLLLDRAAIELGPGSAKGFLRVRQAAGLLLGLRDPTLRLFGLGRTTSFLLGAACPFLGGLAPELGPGSALGTFLRLARGDCGRKLLAPLRFLRIDGVALGESLPLLRKPPSLDCRSPSPHHFGRSNYPPDRGRSTPPEVG